MEFTSINKYESLIEKHLKPSYQPHYAFSFQGQPIQKESIREVLSNLEEINMARSFSISRLNVNQNTPQSNKAKSNKSSEETLQFEQSRTFTSERRLCRNNKNKSLIFNQPAFQKQKELKQRQGNTIKIYYFNLPTNKNIAFDAKTKFGQLIDQAIESYLQDGSLDSGKIENRNHHYFQLRMLLNQNSHKADMNVAPLSHDRLVADNMIDSLVLLQLEKPEKSSFKAEPIQFIKSAKKSSTVITLFNELGDQLGSLHMNKNDSLQKIFDHIEVNDLHNMRNFYLTQSQLDEDALPRDFQIKNLQSNRIYIKSKKYIDESVFQTKIAKPIRSLTIINKQKQPALNLPIGLNEASQYQQFFVIKVNNMGFQQERILGIDQTKIYNYDKNVRLQKKQTGFFSKIFGTNETTGTKRPFRLIENVLDIKKTEKGFILIFKEKSIKYIVKSPQIKQKIIRKLSFLINYSREEKRISQKSIKL